MGFDLTEKSASDQIVPLVGGKELGMAEVG
jgi:hypothetical protein